MVSLFSSKMGIVGSVLRGTIFSLMGFGGYFFPLCIITIGILFIVNRFNVEEGGKSGFLLLIFLCFIIILDVRNPKATGFINKINASIELSELGKGGGIIGSFFGYFFNKLFGPIGTYLVISFITIISILILTDIKLKEIFKRINKIKFNKPCIVEKKPRIVERKPEKNKLKPEDLLEISKEDIKILDYTKNEPKILNKDNNTTKEVQSIEQEIKIKQSKSHTNSYSIPPLNLLKSPDIKQDGSDKKEILHNAKTIEETMKNFGIDATIIQINKGPTITCYELQPAPGIKVSRIVSLSDDIALSLASSDIRIEAPIPGKAAVGIEVPNKMKDNVVLKEILLSDEYESIDSKIPLALGKDISGKPIVSTIDKMPHLLIAGATGSGKSVCINTIIMSILYKSSPDDVKLLLIDPKVVELSIYNGIPHLLIPVVTDAKKAAFALNWAVEEMEKRYKLFAQNNVRDITSYNNKIKDSDDEKLPMMVIVIDELADLMMVAAQEIEDYICRLAQMARAAGMYLIVATQRPSVDVITGTIKANIPSRISFAVSSQVDSRTILDMAGGEKLLGKGDMLFYPSFYSKPSRLQGAFISDEEVERVVTYLKDQNITEYDEDIIEVIQNPKEIALDDSDELLPEAINLVVEEGQASISLLQRKLRIGYARAARIVDEMEERGVIGGYEGSKPRKVLVSKDEFDSMFKER
ncbi:DNA translocase FtsK [Tissierella sp. MSJ-40]|uniref:DNA translocase FtsK n=2 Tax=Tissierella simiarum TaxID=2841534 RepID=A0ABS6E421_9FIRM|nr:DNA translocase FtsK [Tissierella simiarum]